MIFVFIKKGTVNKNSVLFKENLYELSEIILLRHNFNFNPETDILISY